MPLLRQLLKHPFANAVIVLTIALLIGAVSVIYASLRNDRLKLEPFPERERIVKLWRIGENRIEQLFPAALYRDFAENLSSFDEIGAVDWRGSKTLTGLGEPVSYNAAGVSASLLRMTGMTPLQGRLFHESDEQTGVGDRILISEQLWREKLEADPAIIGRELRLNDRIYTVLGVLPEIMRSTRLGFNIDIWQPARFERNRAGATLWLFGRLAPDVSRAQAQAELDAITPGLEQAYTPERHERAVYPGGFSGTRIASLSEQWRPSPGGVPAEVVLVWIFAGIITFSVVGIACFNVSNLLLVRTASRAREFAVRLSLGATRWRIARQILGETLLLAAMGGVAGLAVSFWFHDLLRLQHVDARFDPRLYAIAIAGTILLGTLVAVIPALVSARVNLAGPLKDVNQMVSGRRRHRWRNFLVASEVAMALILCVVAGTLVRSWLHLQAGRLGFDADRTVAVQVDLRDDLYSGTEDRHDYADLALRALNEMPGVEAAAVSINGALFHWMLRHQFQAADSADGEEPMVQAAVAYASRGAAGLEGMRLLAGRDLADDSRRAAGEVLVNESFAREYFRDVDPLGRQLRETQGTNRVTVVGIVSDRHPLTTFQGVGPEVIYGLRAASLTSPYVLIARTRADAKAMADPVRETLKRINAAQPVNQPVFVADLIERRRSDARSGVLTLGGMAGVGLLIALLGVYGVVAFSVLERTREVGVRMAVGASRGSVLRLMLWQGGRLLLLGAVPGLVIGSAIMLGLPRQGLTTQINALDPLTHLGVVLLVGLAGILACILPARKAAKLSPMEALRSE